MAQGAGLNPDRVVFLDRDGVINRDSADFVKSVAEWQPIEGSLEAIARLFRADYRIVIVTNQSGVARGLLSAAALEAIHERLRSDLSRLGGEVAGIFVCPHAPDQGCDCRKPAPGLIREAERALALRAVGAPFVGDRLTDLRAARAAGCCPILIGRGAGDFETDARDRELEGVEIHACLSDFVESLLARES